METQDNIRYATGEEQYELQAAFGDECDYVVNIITGQKTYFNYQGGNKKMDKLEFLLWK